MAVRNCADIGENLHRIIRHLMANDDLVRLLYYSDDNPLNKAILTAQQKEQLVFDKLISCIPRVPAKTDSQCRVICNVERGTENVDNSEFKDIELRFGVFVPLQNWYIRSSNLRLFAILGEIQKSLNGKTVNGIGKLTGGDFTCDVITDDSVVYTAYYYITSYE